MKQSRREWISSVGASLSVGGLLVSGHRPVCGNDRAASQPSQPTSVTGLPDNWQSMRKIDVHNHVMQAVEQPGANWQEVERIVAAAQILGIERLCCSRPLTGGVLADIEQVRQANDSVLAAMRRFPEVISGFCFVQPGNGRQAIDEIDRCLEQGMLGVKLYNQYKYSDPTVFPVAEKCIEAGIPFLGHSAHLTDAKSLQAQPKTSDSLDFCQLSWRYPELMLILGHINGGGDWEWAIKGLRDCPNVFVDTSGSVLENDTIEMCVRELGHQRLLFATDLTMEGGVGKILSARITPEQRQDIFWRNAQKIFDRRKT